jgi:hypothetical protein
MDHENEIVGKDENNVNNENNENNNNDIML